MDVIQYRLTICAQVHASKQDNFVVVRNNPVAPPGTWYIAIDRDSSPSIQLTVIDMQIVESHILDHRKYAIVPACIDHQLVFEKRCRVLGSCNWPTAFSHDSPGQ